MPGCRGRRAERGQRARRAVLDHDELAERVGAGDGGDDPVRRRGVPRDLEVAAEHLGDLARTRDAQQAHAPAGAVLHEEVVADGVMWLPTSPRSIVSASVSRRGPAASSIHSATPGAMKSMPSAPTSPASSAIVPSSATATSLDREVRVAAEHLALARAVDAHGDEHRAQVAPRGLDLVDGR